MDTRLRAPRGERRVVRGPSDTAGTPSLCVPDQRLRVARARRSHRRRRWVRWQIRLAGRSRPRATLMQLQGGTMYRIAMIAAVVVPTLAAAQTTVSASSQASAQAQAGKSNAQASSSVEAEIAIARRSGLPVNPIRRRAAEGRAKGATEAQVALAARRVRMNLEAAHGAMVRAGRTRPSDQETEQGAAVIE